MDHTSHLTVGVDGSDTAIHAVRWAAREAVLRKSGLRLLHVQNTPPSPVDRTKPLPDEGSPDGHKQLTDAESAAAAESPDIPTEHVLRHGDPTNALVEESQGARMLVLGAHGLETLSPAALGSTAEIVALHACCPVAVIHRPHDEGVLPRTGTVLVGVDGSPVGQRALALAFEEASLRRAPLQALHAWSDVPAEPWLHYGNEGWTWDRVEDRERALLAERLAGWQEQYPEVEVERIVVQDRPVRYLVEHASQAQLMIVGSRGRGGFTGMLLGSTSQALLHVAPRPLIIARYETTDRRYRPE